MVERHFRLPAVKELTGLSRSTIYSLMSENKFPRPIKITGKAVAWPESVLEQWLKSRGADE
ncbi:MAG: AlpA family transcriptional regulator [Rhodobacter sp.]|uniref:helix-turn-helix transcriptional regulator n=1 Tax=Pararhodobacter sp. TaxID=2127056 RepID=UPI002BEA4B34|nr:AlpA family transcriptional regulator [Pararhodobacter sp.]MCC0071778.1 AlpA family transcriptional regulator [Rhodobacter sp.]HPD91066.1 AlpA family transcriptional regulator [Pararhodobacter sp.]